MNKDSLKEKLASIEQQFNAASQSKADIEAEIFRLQGDYRTVNDLINQEPPKAKEIKK